MNLPPAFRHRDFSIYWSGLALSSMGSQFTVVAMAWQIYELTDSPLQVGLIGLSRAIPAMAMLLFGGLLADAFDRRRLLALTQCGQLTISVSLFLLSALGLITPVALFLCAAALALFNALETPARQAIVPNLVPAHDLSSALALNGTQRSAGAILGPSLAGLLLAFAGPVWCYAADAVSWGIMLCALAVIRPASVVSSGRGGVTLEALRAGVAFVWANPIILTTILLDFIVNLFGTPQALLPVYARDILGVGPSGLGVLYAAEAVGALVAATVISTRPQIRRAGLGLITGFAIYAVGNLVFAISPVFWLSVLGLAIAGVGDTLAAVLRGTINQLSTPDALRGRVWSVNALFSNSGPSLGQFRAGAIAQRWGAEAAAVSGGAIVLGCAGALLAFPLLRKFELRTEKSA
ncbi:MAG: MFS transporter [Chloroflexota bacterium]